MCNLSQGVLDKGISIGRGHGIEIGRDQGIEIGRGQGIEIGEVKSLRKMMKNFHVTFTEAADALEIPEVDRPKYKWLVDDSDGYKYKSLTASTLIAQNTKKSAARKCRRRTAQ